MTAVSVNYFSRRLSQIAEGLPGPFWMLWVGSLITKAGSFIVPLLFVYLTQTRGLPLSLAGAIVSVYGIGSLVGTFLGGIAADKIGRRATMLVSLVGGAAFMLVLGAATEVWQIILATFLVSMTSDAYRPASQALIADIVPPEHRMKAFSLQYWAVNLGFALSSVVGGYMAKHSFALLFVGDAITTLVLAGFIWRGVPESLRASDKTGPRGSFLTPFVDKRFMLFLFLNFLVVLVFFQHSTALPEDMHSKGLSTADFGLALATNGVLIILLQPLVIRWVADVRRTTLLAIAAALTGMGFGLTAFATTLPHYMASVAIWTLGEVMFAPINASIVAELSPAHVRGRYQGAFGLTWSLGMVLSPTLGPWLMEVTSVRTLWAACFALGLGAALAHLTVMAKVLPGAREI